MKGESRANLTTNRAYAKRYVVTRNYVLLRSSFAVFASLIGVKGKFIMFAPSQWDTEGLVADRDQLHLTEVILEEVPATIPECGKILKPLLDHLANAGGAVSSLSFEADGTYVRRG